MSVLRSMVSAAAVLTLLVQAGPVEARNWERPLKRLEKEIERNEWKEALDRARELRGEMLEEVPAVEATRRAIGRSLLWQAVAEANLGRDEDAIWHWYAAQNELSGLPSMDLTRHDRAAEILAGRSLDDEPENVDAPSDVAGDRPVEILRPVKPRWPAELGASGYEGSVVTEIIIGLDGKPRRPRVIDGGVVPTMAYPALEALAQWRFSPAVRSGRAVPAVYELKINYP